MPSRTRRGGSDALTQKKPKDAQQRKERVREPAIAEETSEPSRAGKRSAHPSLHVIAQLNEKWRVVDGSLQWILQHKKGNPRKKSSGWRGRSFCRTREALLRCVREYCGEVDPRGLVKLKGLPEFHPDWERVKEREHERERRKKQAADKEEPECVRRVRLKREDVNA